MKIAIYLGWIRHNACGGVESFTRNLLDGFLSLPDQNDYVLICSIDNKESFTHYGKDSRVSIVDTGCITTDLKGTIFYENFKLDRLLNKLNVSVCFVPTYRIPLFLKKHRYIGVIHDLQVCHYPEYFSRFRRNWIIFGSKRCAQSAYRTITISDFVRNDIIQRFNCDENRIITIHNPILPNQEFEDFSIISKEYGIEAGSYLYTVSALAKHKNVITLLRLIKLIRDRGDKTIPHKLIVSGIGVKKKDADNIDSSTIFSYVSANNLEDFVIFTGFVSDKRRNSLIINSRFFLYPSLFEGFGMPPLEAMKLGANVITTRCTSLPEVTHDLCFYVDNPVDEKEWYNCIRDNINRESRVIEFEENNPQIVAKKYLEIINQAK